MTTEQSQSPQSAPGGRGRKPEQHNSLIELVLIVGAAVLLAFLIQAFLVKPYRIPSESMVPTLEVGQRVLVSRVNYKFGNEPSRGDVVVFHPPEGADDRICGVQHPEDAPCPQPLPKQKTGDGDTFIKRVVAVPGDRLSIRDGYAVVNGELQKPDYLNPCPPGTCNYPREITIPPDHYFMMGDNRGASDDSRYWGPVPKKWIIGQEFATYWPLNRVSIALVGIVAGIGLVVLIGFGVQSMTTRRREQSGDGISND